MNLVKALSQKQIKSLKRVGIICEDKELTDEEYTEKFHEIILSALSLEEIEKIESTLYWYNNND